MLRNRYIPTRQFKSSVNKDYISKRFHNEIIKIVHDIFLLSVRREKNSGEMRDLCYALRDFLNSTQLINQFN